MSRRALTRAVPVLSEPRALLLPEACRRLGLSLRTGEMLVAAGRFPIPELPQLGIRRHRYSSVHIDEYLRQVHAGARGR
jgi:predicted DNA-binding transcriptional regulator AlpA